MSSTAMQFQGRNGRTPTVAPLPCFFAWLVLPLLLGVLAPTASGQDADTIPAALPRLQYRGGEDTLRAFKPVSDATRNSIVKFNVDGETVALGVVMDASGLALTKASEIKKGKLTCWLATEKEVPAEVLGVDSEEDVALVRVHARGLKPMQWSDEEVVLGEWAITPGVAETPHAVGIISTLPHRVRPPRAFIGIGFELGTAQPRIASVFPGFSAQQAGLLRGDVIVGVNGTAVTNRETVVEMLRDFRAGQTVKLRIERADGEFTAELKLMSRDAAPSGHLFFIDDPPTQFTGQVSHRAKDFEQALEHDTVLQPWLCGGPLVNLEGKGIGLNIARASRVTTYALPASLVRRLYENLKVRTTGKP